MYYVGTVNGSVALDLGRQDSHIQIQITGGPVNVITSMPELDGVLPAPFDHGPVTDEIIILDMYGVEGLTLSGSGDYAVISYLSD